MSTITEKLKWLIEADATSAIKGFDATGKAAETNLKKAQTSGQKLGGQLTKVGAGAIAVSGIIGGALVKAAGSFEDLAIKSGQMADATGLSVDQASRWIEVADDMGIGADTIETALGKMNKTLGATPQKFKDLGIEIAATKTGAEDVNGTFINTIERLNQIQDPAARAAAAASIFGKGWQGAAELLKLSTDDIKTQLASVSDQKVIDEGELQKAKDYRANLDRLKDSAQNLALAIGQGAAPMIGAIASAVGSAVEAFTNLDSISQGAAGGILAAGTAALGTVGAFSVIAGQLIKIKGRFTDAEGAMTSFGKAAMVSAGAAGLVVLAYSLHAQKAAERTKEMAQAIDDLSRVTDAELQDAFWTAVGNGALAGIPATDVIKKMTEANIEGTQRLRDHVQAQIDAGDTSKGLKFQVEALTTAIDNEKESRKQAEITTGKYKDTTEDATTAIDDGAHGVEMLNRQMEFQSKAATDAAKAADELAKNILDLAAAQVEAVGTSGDFEQSIRDLESSYYDLQLQIEANDKAQKDSKLTDEAKAQSARDVASAVHENAVEVFELSQKYAAEKGAVEGSKEQHQLMRDSLELSRQKYPELRDELNRYIALLNLAAAAAGNLGAATGKGGIDYGAPGYAVGDASFASGTARVPGALGQPYPAMLHGGEAVIPAGGNGGGGDVYVTVNLAPGADGDDVIRTIEKWRNRNGNTKWMAS